MVQQDRVRKSRPVAVVGADRFGKPVQLPARTPRPPHPVVTTPVVGEAAQSTVVNQRTSRTARAHLGDVEFLDLVEPGHAVGGQDTAEAWSETGTYHNRGLRLAVRRLEAQDGHRLGQVVKDHDRRPTGSHCCLGRR